MTQEDYIVISIKEIKKETDKAYMVILNEEGYEDKETWFPKSECAISNEDCGNGIMEDVLLASPWIWEKRKEELDKNA